MADRDRGARLVRLDDLRRCLATAFERLRLTPEDAEGLSGLLVESEPRGHPDHGEAPGIIPIVERCNAPQPALCKR
jgi:hypothetical protein